MRIKPCLLLDTPDSTVFLHYNFISQNFIKAFLRSTKLIINNFTYLIIYTAFQEYHPAHRMLPTAFIANYGYKSNIIHYQALLTIKLFLRPYKINQSLNFYSITAYSYLPI